MTNPKAESRSRKKAEARNPKEPRAHVDSDTQPEHCPNVTKQLTITLDEEVYRGLRKLVGDDQISGYIERLVRPHLPLADLEEGYRAMAADAQREAEALEWTENLIAEVSPEAR